MKDKMVRFIDCYIPTEVCNLKCPYCYISQRGACGTEIKQIGHSPEKIRTALSKKRLGGSAFINMCANGETLLGDEVLPIVYELIKEGHYVQIVTNGTVTKRFEELSQWPREILGNLFIKFSFHYTEFKRLNLLDVFFANVNCVWEAGASITIEITPSDEMVQDIDEIKKISIEKVGALPHITVARDETISEHRILTKYSEEEYKKIWGEFNSPLFDLKMKLVSEEREEYCYAGDWTLRLKLDSGELRQCYKGAVIDNIYRNIEAPLHFHPIGKRCPEKYCYNGHAWMTMGCIPNKDIPYYSEMRNRVCVDGREWLQPKMKTFFAQKLQDQHVVFADTSNKPKVLLLGDSICMGHNGLPGYSAYVKEYLEGKAIVYCPNVVARFSTYLLRYIHEWAKTLAIGSNIDIVHFNVGLWDVLRLGGDEPLVSLDEYKMNLIKIIHRLKQIFPNAGLVFATTTYVQEENAEYDFCRKNADIVAYNQCAYEVMQEYGVIVNELNKVSEDLKDCYADWTHFDEQGSRELARVTANCIWQRIIEGNQPSNEMKKLISDKMVIEQPEVLKDKRVIIYGAGQCGEIVFKILTKNGIDVHMFCDKSEKKKDTLLCGTKVTSPEEYLEKYVIPTKDMVLVAIENASVVESVIHNFSKVEGLMVCTKDCLWYLE